MALESKRPNSGPLFRVGRMPDPWEPPDWAYAKEDHTFGNRFDDPEGLYRVLYASSQRIGCFVETLARFRVSLEMIADLAEMENGEDELIPFGAVSRTWVDERSIGAAVVRGEYADIYALGWMAHLRTALAIPALKLGMLDIDLSALELTQPRIFTQKAGREAYARGFDGVFYHSKYGHQIENWAIFEFNGFPITNTRAKAITEDDPDLIEAMRILQLAFMD